MTDLRIIALLAMSICSACDEQRPSEISYEIAFKAVDDRGMELAGIAIKVGETLLGATDQNGSLRVEVQAREGEQYPLHAPCPKTYLPKDPPTEIFFRGVTALHGEALTQIDLRLVCARSSRVAALMVHADGYANMPILIDGVAQASTGPDGFAHLRLDLAPGAQFQVSLDSSVEPTLVPVNPSQTMSMGEEDGLFVFDPTFREAPREKKPVRVRPRKKRIVVEPTPKRPVRID